MDSKAIVWVRGETVINGVVPVAPPVALTFANIRKFVAYEKQHGADARLSWSAWQHVASVKMKFSLDQAWIYYSTCARLCYPTAAEADLNLAAGPDAIASAPSLAHFALFLCLQLMNRSDLAAQRRADEPFPSLVAGRASSPCHSRPSSSADSSRYSLYQQACDLAAHVFLERAMDQLLSVLALLAGPPISDYHRVSHTAPPPVTQLLDADHLAPLDLLFEGVVGQLTQPEHVQPLPLSQLLGSVCGRGWKASAAEVCGWLRGWLRADPFFELADAARSKEGGGEMKGHLRLSGASWPRRQLVAGRIVRQLVVKDSAAMRATHLRLANCNGASVYLLAPFRTATIEHCVKCTIVLGAVEQTVRLRHCRHCTFVVPCRALLLSQTANCTVHLHSPAPPTLLNGNTDLTLAPYHTTYPNLETDLVCAGLPLLTPRCWAEPRVWAADKAGYGWTKADPSTLFPLRMPVSAASTGEPVPKRPSGKQVLRDIENRLPGAYKACVSTRLDEAERLGDELAALPSQQKRQIEATMEAAFSEWLRNNGHLGRIEQTQACLAKRKLRKLMPSSA